MSSTILLCYTDIEVETSETLYETVLRSSHIDGKSRGIVSLIQLKICL